MPVLVITFIVLVVLVLDRGADYRFDGSYLLSGETIEAVGDGLDPEQVADVLGDRLVAPSVRTQLQAEGFTADYTTAVGQSGTAVRLTVTGDTAAVVVNTANAVLDLVPGMLTSSFDTAASTVTARATVVPTAGDVSTSGNTYSVTTSIIVSPASVDSGNPFDATLSTALTLVRLASSADFADAIAALAPGATFEVTSNTRDAALVDVTVTAPSVAEARTAYEAVRDRISDQLVQLQDGAGVNRDFRTILRPIIEPAVPEETAASLVRPIAGLVILGTGLAVGLAILAESLAVAKRRGEATGGVRPPNWVRRLRGRTRADKPTSVSTVDSKVDSAVAADRVDVVAEQQPVHQAQIIYDVEAEDVAAGVAVAEPVAAVAVGVLETPVDTDVAAEGEDSLNGARPNGDTAEAHREAAPPVVAIDGASARAVTATRSARPTRRPARKR